MSSSKRSRLLNGVLLTLFMAMPACGSPDAQPPAEETPAAAATGEALLNDAGYRDVTTSEVVELVRDPDVVVVNVHIPYEGEIPGTDLHIPYDDLEPYLDQLPADRDAPILLYCRSGRMSEIAGAELAGRGYTNVMHHVGGMVDWQAEGFELTHQEAPGQ